MAHDFWIEPLDYEVAAGKPAAVRLRVGEHFAGESILPRPESVAAFFADDGDERRTVSLAAGVEPLGLVATRKSGPLAIGYESRPSSITLTAERFESYLREEGLEHVIAERRLRGESAAPGRELFARSVKSLLRTAGDHHGSTAPAALGLPLELVPATDPYTLTSGSPLELQLLYQGGPAADVLVVAVPATDPGDTRQARTDASGRVTFALDREGAWLLKAVHMDAAPADSGADWMSWWTSLTFSIRGS